MDLIYFEPLNGGFHTGHCRIFLEGALRDVRVRSIHFAVAEGFQLPGGNHPEVVASSKVSFEYLSPLFSRALAEAGPLRRGRLLWQEARRLVSERPGAICFLNMCDLALLGSVFDWKPLSGAISGIIHFPPFNQPFRSRPLASLRRWAIRRGSHFLANYRAIPILLTFDEYYLQTLPRFVARHWRSVPDPVPLDRQAMASAFRPRSRAGTIARTRFLMFGSLGRRKGLFAVLEALGRMRPEERQKCNLVLAGEIREGSRADREELSRLIDTVRNLEGVSITYLDRFLSESELADCVNDCDVVLAPYIDHVGVSGVLVWASAAGKPVIAQSSGWIGHVVRQHNLGLLVDASSPGAVAKVMMQGTDPAVRAQFDPVGLRRFAQCHSADDFFDAVISALAQLSATETGRTACAHELVG